MVRALPNTDNALLIRDYLETSITRLLPAIIRLASLNHPDSPIEPCIQILHNRDRARLPFVLELFDTLLTPVERHKISSLLERYERATSRPGTPVHSDAASPHLLAWLKESVNSEDEWLRAIALDYVLSTGAASSAGANRLADFQHPVLSVKCLYHAYAVIRIWLDDYLN